MYKKLLVAIGATIASTAAMTPAAAELLSKGAGLPFSAFGAFGCGFSVGFPWMGGLFAGPGMFSFGVPFWW